MAKGDTDRLREMREQRFTEKTRPAPAAKKPPRTELQHEIDKLIELKVPAPDLKPTKPAKNVATKSRKQVAEAIGKARDRKAQLSVWIDPEVIKSMKLTCVEHDYKIEAFVERAIRVFIEHGEPENR